MEAATTPPETPEVEAEKTEDEQHVPYERFKQANTKAKEAAQKAAALEKSVADLQAQIEERESAGLPELEQLRKRLEQAEKRADQAEQAKQAADTQIARGQKERWV